MERRGDEHADGFPGGGHCLIGGGIFQKVRFALFGFHRAVLLEYPLQDRSEFCE